MTTTSLRAGDRLDERYEISALIGRGGMAEVFRAHDHVLGRAVAIKVPLPAYRSDPSFRERFEQEARAASSLAHPNIVTLLDRGVCDDQPYLVMEHVGGGTARELVQRSPSLDLDRVLDLVSEVALALQHAHGRGVLHRDLKPDNILLARDGSVKVADFGLAGLVSDASTEPELRLSSAAYLAPERIHGDPGDRRSDLYALGVVLYELLAGERPFDGTDARALARAHVTAPVPDVRAHRPETPRAVVHVVQRALAKDPADRYPDAAALRDDLHTARHGRDLRTQVLEAMSAETDEPTTTAPADWVPTQSWRVAVTGALLFLGLGLVAAADEAPPAAPPEVAESPAEAPADGTGPEGP